MSASFSSANVFHSPGWLSSTKRNRSCSYCERLDGHVVEVAGRTGVHDHDLPLDGQRHVLALLEQLDQALAALELAARRGVEIARELRERRHLAVLREIQAQRAGDLLHRLDLRVAADAADGDADVDGRTDAGEEQVALEEDLPVGDRDHVGRDVRRHVAGLRLDDRQRRQRAARVRILRELEDALSLWACNAFSAASLPLRPGASGRRRRGS